MTLSVVEYPQGIRLCSALVTEAALRRGARVILLNKTKFSPPAGCRLIVMGEGRAFPFARTTGPLSLRQAIRRSQAKDQSKLAMSANGVPTPKSVTYEPNGHSINPDELVFLVKDLRFPVVLKPSSGSGGLGIFTNIGTIDELADCITASLEQNAGQLIIEEQVEGQEIRAFVAGGKFICATGRRPPTVTGDGKLSIAQLIARQNRVRKRNPHTASRLVNAVLAEKMLNRTGHSLSEILPVDVTVRTTETANFSQGADSIDFTNIVPDSVKRVAEAAVAAMGGLANAGVDIIYSTDVRGTTDINVLEVNSKPNIGSHVFPVIGERRRPHDALISYYLPTSQVQLSTEITINLKDIFSQLPRQDAAGFLLFLNENASNGLSVEPLTRDDIDRITAEEEAKADDLVTIRFRCTGKVQGVGFRSWCIRKGRLLRLTVKPENLSDGSVVVTVDGPRVSVSRFLRQAHFGPSRARVNEVNVI